MVGSSISSAAGNHRPDFNEVGIGKHFIFRHELVTPDDQMRLHHEIKFTQQILGALGAFDLNLALGMTELDIIGDIKADRVKDCKARERVEYP